MQCCFFFLNIFDLKLAESRIRRAAVQVATRENPDRPLTLDCQDCWEAAGFSPWMAVQLPAAESQKEGPGWPLSFQVSNLTF
jgi:hypothetical protein